MLKPLRDQIIVRPIEDEPVSKTIVTPEQAKKRPSRGQVVAIGSGRVLQNGDVVLPSVKVGDTVIFGKYSGHEVYHEDELFFVMKEIDIFAVIYANRESRRKDK